jgi:hypothetical protein
MNIFQATYSAFASWLLAGKRAQQESEQQGPEGRAYSKWLKDNGYEAQYQAYLKAHNDSNEGFVYKDPGNPPASLTTGDAP